jgi:type IV pilus assembly protein PilM
LKLELKKPNISLEFLDRISPFKPKYPFVAAELNTKALIMVKMRKEKEQWHLADYSIRELPGNVIGQSIFRPEITSREALISAFKEITMKMGLKSTSISIAIPDNIVRVSLLSLPEIPRSRKQLIEVIKWKIRKAIPFKIDDAMISYQVLENGDGFGERVVLVSLMRRETINQYEDIFASNDFKVGLVDCTTFNIYNLYRAQMIDSGDVGLINGSHNYFTFMILRNGKLIFFRCKNYQVEKELSEEEVGKVLSRELNTSLSYYSEKLGGKGFKMTYYRTAGHDAQNFRSIIEKVGLSPCEVIDLSKVIQFQDFSNCDEITRSQLAPAIGTVVGRRL